MTDQGQALGRFDALFARHRTATIPELWPWQREILASYETAPGDVAIDLPTGTGKTLLGLLIGEDLRDTAARPVAYLAGNKSLAQQVERQARHLGLPIVRFQGSKDGWSRRDVRAYNYAEAIGVMNYWNYFNASPGVEPAGMLILDDVHLLEQPLREMYSVVVPRSDVLYEELLRRIVARCPYYTLADDLLRGVEPPQPPEMLVFPDSADLADEVRDLIDSRLVDGSARWWSWQRIRDRLEVCCWLISGRSVTFTPYVPPVQTFAHFATPTRRVYMSATIGEDDDLRRRIGSPPFQRLSASVQPRQGERLIVVSDGSGDVKAIDILDSLAEALERSHKILWLCARRETASMLTETLRLVDPRVPVRLLEGDNGADEAFATDPSGHLVTAGRYDGMDFPDDTCRIEVLPEAPIATGDLEQWTAAYLRDAAFGEARFAQRLAQALGRCNRSENDRAVYVLSDPEFLARLSERRVLDSLPDDVRADVFAGVDASDAGYGSAIRQAAPFLDGESPSRPPPPRRGPVPAVPATATGEVDGFLALWREDYGHAGRLFDEVAQALGTRPEHRAFWLAMRALALHEAARFGDRAASVEVSRALEGAATAGSKTTFFTRLRLAAYRARGEVAVTSTDGLDELFAAWDRLIARYGSQGPRFDRWTASFPTDLASQDHDTVARAIARFGSEVLGFPSDAPTATSGQHDAEWELSSPSRVLTFEVKLAPKAMRVINEDIEQAEGSARAVEAQRQRVTKGLLVTPWGEADPTAIDRLDRVRLIRTDVLIGDVRRLLGLLQDYRRGWSEKADDRLRRRDDVEPRVPPRDWLWRAIEACPDWLTPESTEEASRPEARAG